MRRRDFIQAIVGSSVASPLTAWAQQSGRIRLIGVLINAPENDPEMQASLIAFKKELERLNWLDEGNARFDIRFTEGDLGQMRRLTKEMVAMQPDVIFVHTTPLVAVAQKETSMIPIVFVNASDPVAAPRLNAERSTFPMSCRPDSGKQSRQAVRTSSPA
jgi:putative ABC transport system substrate-binding protein